MRVQIVDSPHRCKKCSKRMVQESGQNETDGDLEIVHTCWSCDWTFTERPERDKPVEAPVPVTAEKPVTAPAAIQAILEEAS